MAEQPEVLARFAAAVPQYAASVRELVARRPAGVAFVARGSSDHAAMLGRYAVELFAGVPASLVAPSVHTVYGGSPDYTGWIVVALSQSGATPEIVAVTQQLADLGAQSVAITNDTSSALAQQADVTLGLDAGPEEAVPATKTVTTQFLAMLAVATGLGGQVWEPGDLEALPGAVADVLADDEPAQRVAREIASAQRLVVAARGLLYPAALETALKLQETTGIMAHGYSSADLRHGPIATVGPEVPTLLLAAHGTAGDAAQALRQELAARGAPSYLAAPWASADLVVPDLPEPLANIACVVRGQQVARSLALLRGIDPDQPHGLRKVTPTH